ncbi:hypothetical protein G6O67_004188 [Ophiocordyceps sinensis]|uniref:SCP domain-containing protein n=2 Tax=Ophiocordyceps sinensis TaxID=72228 RepID=A0A8H4LY80_9HYPO|nr:hypothetical protein OCS_01718 [Ophiocordyceps sinensis CO18]KAF4507719.1 hypothetical protein G6O67_004188 [Ophiocordyceps sinensis]
MGFLAPVLPLVLLAFAPGMSVTLSLDAPTQDVHVQWQHDKVSNEMSLSVLDDSYTRLLAHSCNAHLSMGDTSISVDADADAQGSLTVDGKSYLIHSMSEHSGGATCNSMYNEHESFFDCRVKLPAHVPAHPLDPALSRACFPQSPNGPVSGMLVARALNATDEALQDVDGHVLERRWSFPEFLRKTLREPVLVGDGDPHQHWRYVQTTGNVHCGDEGCSIGSSKGQTVSASISGKLSAWASLGFNVGSSFSIGTSTSCSGKAHQTICEWYKVAYTSYNVCLTSWKKGCHERFVIRSPNNNNQGGRYCVHGPGYCRYKGAKYWDLSNDRPGPPPL